MGSRSDVNLHHPQTATAGDTSGPGTVKYFVIYWLLQNGMNKNQHQEWHQRETIHDKFIIFEKLVRQNKSIGWATCVSEMCWRNFCVFSLVTKKRWKVNQNSPFFFQMSTVLKVDFQKRKQLHFSEENYLNKKLHKKKTQFCMWQLHFP